jgi:hypothetical protein
MQRVTDARNEYVHYKWGESTDESEKRLELALSHAEDVVTHLEALGDALVYENKRHEFK